MIGVGNEQWGKAYVDRYKVFATALKAKYPKIRLVTSAGPSPSGPLFEYLWPQMRELKADLVDEHYYQPPQWFLDNSRRYDNYPRNGPKVFAGEYAAHQPDRKNNWGAAVAEAAFMTGLERNADLVEMASYAPLLAHVDAWQWAPDLIWFDNLRSFGTPSYYVQKLFATNLGSRILPVGVPNAQNGLYTSAALETDAREVILKVVNSTKTSRTIKIALTGASASGTAKALVLGTQDLAAENSLETPTNVAPEERSVAVTGASPELTLGPSSVTVLRLPIR
jgi:alpha-N-arabinofuranosidase